MKIRDLLVVGSLAFIMSCSTKEIAGSVEDLKPSVQSCNEVQGQDVCAEGAGDDLAFAAACEGSGTYSQKSCADENPDKDIALTCEGLDIKGLKGDVFLYQEFHVQYLTSQYGDDACGGLKTLLDAFVTE